MIKKFMKINKERETNTDIKHIPTYYEPDTTTFKIPLERH